MVHYKWSVTESVIELLPLWRHLKTNFTEVVCLHTHITLHQWVWCGGWSGVWVERCGGWVGG